ncbi:hypothetical protein E2C01_079853 [Portunus trituberculatus]|uniref:Uncharacterized protein n=1 Tax=Portunus trituberculatus TaxID=210409 RepID=A0A5B7IY23_PORTR|nr:hypothetical protein [Portunus trituberculatus]
MKAAPGELEQPGSSRTEVAEKRSRAVPVEEETLALTFPGGVLLEARRLTHCKSKGKRNQVLGQLFPDEHDHLLILCRGIPDPTVDTGGPTCGGLPGPRRGRGRGRRRMGQLREVVLVALGDKSLKTLCGVVALMCSLITLSPRLPGL